MGQCLNSCIRSVEALTIKLINTFRFEFVHLFGYCRLAVVVFYLLQNSAISCTVTVLLVALY